MNAPYSLQVGNEPLIYFGKLPSRGDFVRSQNGSAVINTLDRWISACLERLAGEANWKAHFDALPGVLFAFAGSRNASLLVGRLASSQDSSGRRFPFLVAGCLRTEAPLSFLPGLPLAMHAAWIEMEQLMRDAREASDISEALARISVTPLQAEHDTAALHDQLAAHLESHTVGNLESSLAAAGNPCKLHLTVTALGLLLSPLLTSGSAGASKGLALPLPDDNSSAAYACCFWLSLVTPFLARGEHEISLMRSRLAGRQQLIIGFSGANPQALEATFNPALAFDANIDLCEADWVEDYLAGDYALTKLSSYLEHPDLSLSQALATFGEVFLGN